ncbi:MAG TPA: PSD1 and planctomycete cytochrome C domain-containing protein [Pirellulaceae bacterium]|nr:PSD1 and planctomycete cytochrome C domain-containing protein [Pirellulaceae bacterium]
MFSACVVMAALAVSSLGLRVNAAENAAPDGAGGEFFFGLNLNGPPVVIDGRDWEGKASPRYESNDNAFDNQAVELVPSTDADRARMIRSSRWGSNRITIRDVPSGRYSVFLYVWEDNNPETFSISVNGRTVVAGYVSGTPGSWERLGPWYVDAEERTLRIESQGGAANFSGIEIWRGEHAGDAPALSAEDEAFFESKIRPLLVSKCYECHSADAGAAEADLFVDNRVGMRRGGVSGPAVTPGHLDRSLLIRAVRYEDAAMQMPPDGKLSAAEIADLERWIKLGAPDPRSGAPPSIVRNRIDFEKARESWSLRPISDPPVPAVADEDWAWTDVDRFVLAQLEQRGLRPVGLADKRTMIRRATFDLTGLPPMPEEIAEFLADDSPQAFERVVDRLLASPRYGERWGRRWLDLVRYADTAGDNSDFPVPQAYLYRNYVIDAFNDDKPYDRFLVEQIAGDLLPADNDEQRNEQIVATGYLAISRRFGSLLKNYPQHLTIEDTIDNLSRTTLGLTLSCARCHDHKFDPLSQADYYAIYGIFDSTRYPFPGIELSQKQMDFVPLFEDGKPGKSVAYAMQDAAGHDASIQLRGEPERLGEVVPRRFLEVLGGEELPEDERSSSGRLFLAERLVDPANPLTARVIANRIWQGHFGAGLVDTPSDFGVRGVPPTHPELLDHLAASMVADGWSIKRMHKRLMLSRVYSLASDHVPESFAVDAENDYLWRYSRTRMDAETLRDSLLFLSGGLDLTPANEPHPFPPADQWKYTQHHPFRDQYDSNRRSVYLMTSRLNALPFFTTFDGPDRNATTPTRDSSTTSVQALWLLNDAFPQEQAGKFAERVVATAENPSDRIRFAFEAATGREPSKEDVAATESFLVQAEKELVESGLSKQDAERESWSAFARSLLRTNAFLYID